MEFVAGLVPCPACGDHRDVAWEAGGHGTMWTLDGMCPRCRTLRHVSFESPIDPIAVDHADLELGGTEASSILEPYSLMTEIDRLAPLIALHTDGLGGGDWSANWDRLDRVRTALNELAKFVPAGAEAITTTGSAMDAADRLARPGRYTRTWIEAERAHWKAIADRMAEDFRRVADADPILSRATPPRGRFDQATIEQHEAWLARGRTGVGRLDVVTTDAREILLEGPKLVASHLEGALFANASLDLIRFDEAELIDVDFAGASLEAASFAHATIRGVCFDRARLQSTSWNGATVTGGSLRDAQLYEATLDKATFVDCDLRRCSLEAASVRGAVFERCDLRGVILTGAHLAYASFVACRFAGALGMPASTEGWTVSEADFAEAGLPDLGDAEDLLAELGS